MRNATTTTVMLKTGGLGDLLMLTPAIRAYRKSFPDEEIIFIVGKSNQEVLKNNPYIDKVLTIDDYSIFQGNLLKKLAATIGVIGMIRQCHPQNIFILHRDWRWNLAAYLSGVSNRYGFRRDFKGVFLTHASVTNQEEHEIHKYLKLCSQKEGYHPDGSAMEIFPRRSDEERLTAIFGDLGDYRWLIALSPGGAANVKEEMDIRRWPLDYYKQLVTIMLDRTDGSILLIGAKSDNPFNDALMVDERRVFNLSGKTNIAQTYLALRKCQALITHDSGPMHLGAAAQIPVIGLFGPTYPAEKYPLTHPLSRYFWEGSKLPCSPCYRDGKFPDCPYGKKCMFMISPETVFVSLSEIISKGT